MFERIITSYRYAFRLWLPLLASHLFVRLLIAALVAPVISALLGVTLAFSEQSALTDQDIARFLLTPMGALGALIIGSFLIVAAVVDVAFMTAVIRAGGRTVGVSLRAGAGFVISVAPRLVVFALHLLVRLLALSLPFAAVTAAGAAVLLTEFDINYYLANRPPSFLAAVAIGGVCGLLLALLLASRLSAWAVALHYCIFDRVPAKQAFALSAIRMTGHRADLVRSLVGWAVLRFLLASVVLGVVGFLLAEVPQLFDGNLRLYFAAVALLLVIWFLANGLVNALANGALSDMLNDEFDRALEGRDTKVHVTTRAPVFKVIAVPAALMIATVASLFLGGMAFNRIGGPDQVEVIGHRGAAASRPENTMAAVVKAVEDGSDWVEIDVQETADGEVIVVHDSDFMKSAGNPIKVWDATMADIAEIDIGSWFDPQYSNERAPLLSEVLEAVRDRAKLIIELKYYGHDVDLENRVIALVEEAGMEDQIATMSLKYPAVQKMRSLRPDWRTGVLAATSIGDLTGLEGDFLAVSSAGISQSLLRRAAAAGKDVYVWTVNDAASISRMISMGASGLITDKPDLAREVIAYHTSLTTAERFMLRLGAAIGFAFDFTPESENTV
ncbi:MAG: glycerophosphodiester phosphodiesterase family protein [Roseobacter sp.]|jgi:glycerophosphoryl diester phosphodiesterase|nr:glycerophosphodiester phosphodiesterase family protein [Roseobacter sp.]